MVTLGHSHITGLFCPVVTDIETRAHMFDAFTYTEMSIIIESLTTNLVTNVNYLGTVNKSNPWPIQDCRGCP